MATESIAHIERRELAQIVESVFATMMQTEVSESEAPLTGDGDRLTAAVHLAGEWNGAVMLECDRSQACRFAGRFLSVEAPSAVDNDVRDVLGELANMIGGNLKCMLSQGIHLSSPTVVDGSDYAMRICGTEMRLPFAFDCEDGLFWIVVQIGRASK